MPSHLRRLDDSEQLSSLDRDFCQSSSQMPPLDEVTVWSDMASHTTDTSFSSSDEYEDVSSVSSDERSDADTCSPPSSSLDSPRSIFSHYWAKKGGGPVLRQATPVTEDRDAEDSSSLSGFSSSVNTYERSLKVTEAIELLKSHSPRRRLFQGNYESAPTLFNTATIQRYEDLRKGHSAPALISNKKLPLRSCLRSSFKSDRSITFSDQVHIVVFQQPTEMWAPKHWSQFFV